MTRVTARRSWPDFDEGVIARDESGPLLKELNVLAGSQFGVVTRAQLIELGLSGSRIGRALSAGSLTPARPGVYRLLGATPSREQEIEIALLWAGKGAFASHRTAAGVHGLLPPNRAKIEVTTSTKVRASDVIVHARASWPSSDVIIVEGLRVGAIERTLLDLASVVSRPKLGRALDAALRLGVGLDAISDRLEATAVQGRTGVVKLRGLIEERAREQTPLESPLERDFLNLVRARNIPEPVAQFKVLVDGHVVARLDFAYPELKIGIELDGYAFHSERDSFDRDRRRLTELVNGGWHMLVFTWPQVVGHPGYVEKSVLKARALVLDRSNRAASA